MSFSVYFYLELELYFKFQVIKTNMDTCIYIYLLIKNSHICANTWQTKSIRFVKKEAGKQLSNVKKQIFLSL